MERAELKYILNSMLNYSEITTIFLTILGLIVLLFLIPIIIGEWKVLKKAGKSGWGALIPIYNIYLLCEITGVNSWWMLILFLSPLLDIIPIIGELAEVIIPIYFAVLLNVSLAKSFNKEPGYAVGLILLAPIFYLILGLEKENNYIGKKPMKDIIFDSINSKNESNENNNQQYQKVKYCTYCGKKIDIDTKYCPNCGKEL